jgi:hypothetical protein
MSQFYGSMGGQSAKEVTRTGTTNTGVYAHVRGWDVGVHVLARATRQGDEVLIFSTKGSNGHEDHHELVGRVFLDPDGHVVFDPNPRRLREAPARGAEEKPS